MVWVLGMHRDHGQDARATLFNFDVWRCRCVVVGVFRGGVGVLCGWGTTDKGWIWKMALFWLWRGR